MNGRVYINHLSDKVSLTKLGSDCLMRSKVNLLTLGCGEGKYNVYCRVTIKEKRHLQLKRPELLMAFEAGFFKTTLGMRDMGSMISSCTFF